MLTKIKLLSYFFLVCGDGKNKPAHQVRGQSVSHSPLTTVRGVACENKKGNHVTGGYGASLNVIK